MRRHIPSLALVLALGSCCTDPVDQSSYFCLGEMSVQDEQQLGATYAPNIDAMYDGVLNDPTAAEYLGGLVKEMAGHSVHPNDFTWNFTILNTSMPNAFAVPGGYIYITRGLLAAMETEGQFISVMGHELGHVEHKHSQKGMGGKILGGVLVGVIGTAESTLTKSEEPGLVTSITAAGTQLVMLSYDRDQELQSDQRGVYYAAAMGYDPADAVKTFEYFQSLEDKAGGVQIEWLRTHPLNDHRIDDIRSEIQASHPELVGKDPSTFRPVKDNNARFRQVVALIKQRQPIYDRYDEAWKKMSEAVEKDDKPVIREALASFQGCASDLPDEALFHTAVGMAHVALDEYGAAKTALNRAISLDNAALPDRTLYRPHLLLGLVLFEQKEYANAEPQFDTALAAYPMGIQSLYYLGRCYEEQGQTSKATEAYKKVISMEGNPKGVFSTKANQRLSEMGVQ
ncbi:MAG: M48 family metalloprotease [Planctomycetota bacterium]